MLGPRWMKSSYSTRDGACVQARFAEPSKGTAVQIGDTKNPDGPTLTVTPAAFTSLLDAIKSDELR